MPASSDFNWKNNGKCIQTGGRENFTSIYSDLKTVTPITCRLLLWRIQGTIWSNCPLKQSWRTHENFLFLVTAPKNRYLAALFLDCTLKLHVWSPDYVQQALAYGRWGTVPCPPSDPKNKKMYKQYSEVA